MGVLFVLTFYPFLMGNREPKYLNSYKGGMYVLCISGKMICSLEGVSNIKVNVTVLTLMGVSNK